MSGTRVEPTADEAPLFQPTDEEVARTRLWCFLTEAHSSGVVPLEVQDAHALQHPRVDPRARERWRGHPHFEWAATFVDRYDQAALDPAYDCAPLSHFEPMVMRLFAREPRRLPLD